MSRKQELYNDPEFEQYSKIFNSELCNVADINPSNLSLVDRFAISIIYYSYIATHPNDTLRVNEACRFDMVLFSAHLAHLSFITFSNNFESHINFRDTLCDKLYLILLHLGKLKSNSDVYFTERLNYYYEHSFDEEDEFDSETLIQSFVNIITFDKTNGFLAKPDGSVPLIINNLDDFRETVLQATAHFFAISEVFESFHTNKDSNKTTVSKSKINNTSDIITLVVGENISEGNHSFIATHANGGFVKIDNEKFYIENSKNFKLQDGQTVKLINCKLFESEERIIDECIETLRKPKTNKKPSELSIEKHTNNPPQKKYSFFKLPQIILASLIFLSVVLLICAFSKISKNDSDTTSTSQQKYTTFQSRIVTTTQIRYIEYEEPKSGQPLFGTTIYNSEYDNCSELTIKASSTESCVVKLKNRSGDTVLSFFVRAGDKVTVGVPREQLFVYFASGDTWYGLFDLFGEYTSYSKDSTICNFEEYTYEYTLYPVSSGNFSETPISADEF